MRYLFYENHQRIHFIIFFISCQNSTNFEINYTVSLRTEKSSYQKMDSIKVILLNDSYSSIVIGLRCGNLLEMEYQKKVNNTWSENFPLWYLKLGCVTISDTLEAQKEFHFSIDYEIIDTAGTYRFVINYYVPEEKKLQTIFSNTFEIK